MGSAANGLGTVSQDSLRKVLDAMEGQSAAAMERLVAGEGFSELLVRATENMFALAKIRDIFWDMALSNLRVAGRRDIDRVARQLRRSEDKLELLLQAVERVEALSDRG